MADIPRPRAQLRRAVLSSYLGSVIEYYDFLVYGTASALVLPRLFFPGFSPLAGTLAAFATFVVVVATSPRLGQLLDLLWLKIQILLGLK